MADPSRSPGAERPAGRDRDRGAANRTSRWAIVLGVVVAIALLALIVLLHATGTLGPGAH